MYERIIEAANIFQLLTYITYRLPQNSNGQAIIKSHYLFKVSDKISIFYLANELGTFLPWLSNSIHADITHYQP
jgi:hypothetical protein